MTNTRNKLSRIQASRFLLEMHETDKGVVVYVQADWKHTKLQATRITFTFPVSVYGYSSFVEARKAGMVQLVALIQAALKFPASEGYDGDCLEYCFKTNSFKASYHYEDSPRLNSDYRLQVKMPVGDLISKYLDEIINVKLNINKFNLEYRLTGNSGAVIVTAPWEAVDSRNKLIFSHPVRLYNGELDKVLMAIIAKFVVLAAASAKFNLNYAHVNTRLVYYEVGNYFNSRESTTVVDPTTICNANMAQLAATFQGHLRTS
jgi:hypothetical protein